MTLSAYNGTPAQPQPRESGITQWGQLGEILGGVRFPEQTARSGFAAAQAWGLANNTGKKNLKRLNPRIRGDRSAQKQGGPRSICVRSSVGQSARLRLWRPRVQAPPGVPEKSTNFDKRFVDFLFALFSLWNYAILAKRR